MTTPWTAAHLQAMQADHPAPRLITAADITHLLPGHDLWDFWPLTLEDGTEAPVEGGTLWFVLSAPHLPDPAGRHATARIRLLHRTGSTWHDRGPALPPGTGPGSREWSGGAVLAGTTVRLYFTAAGRTGEPAPTFEQRLFRLHGTLTQGPAITWHGTPTEIVASDDATYVRVNQPTGLPGQIKAFRDPAWFRDPADGAAYLTFAGSWKDTPDAFNGVAGLARATDATLEHWQLLPPLVSAIGVNNELERPHLVHRNGRYYLFWSTQRHTFAPGIDAPTGLYGMVASALQGPYTPLNGSGLVLANPAAEPAQAYSWWVTPDGHVSSFVDYWAMEGRTQATHPDTLRACFGGAWAPELTLALHGTRAWLTHPG